MQPEHAKAILQEEVPDKPDTLPDLSGVSGMNKPVSSEKTKGLHPKFQEILLNVIEKCREIGLNVDAHQGFRSFEQQAKLYAQGRTIPGKKVTNAAPGSSWHNYGLAADLVFQVNGKWSWSESHDWKRLGEVGKSFGLEWGGDWKKFPDRPHFQAPISISTREAKKLYNSGGLEAVWEHVKI